MATNSLGTEHHASDYRADPVPCSSFLRNPRFFEVILDRVIPELLERAPSGKPLKIVSAGCARGEEPYGLALAIAEKYGTEALRGRFEIVGIDSDPRLIESARSGIFEENQIEALPEEWRGRRLALLPDGRRRIASGLTEPLRFEQRDILVPWDLGLPCDLVLLRNVFLYLSPEGRQKALCHARAALVPGGFLALGQSEALPEGQGGHWEPYDRLQRIYRRPGRWMC